MNENEAIDVEPVNSELDLTIGQRLAVGFGALLVVILAFAAAVLAWHSQSAAAQRHYTDRIAPLTQRAGELERYMLYAGITMRSYLLVPEPQRLSNYRSYAEQSRRALAQLESAAELPEGAPDIRELGEGARVYLEETDRLVAKRRNGPLAPDDEATAAALRERSLADVRRLIDLQAAQTKQALERMSAARDTLSIGLLVLSGVGTLLCLAIAWFTAQSIRRPTRALVHVAGAMEQRERELREKNEKIQSQSEELQSQSEELHAQNEELIQQGHELLAQSNALTEANERKNHFLGVLAHELRNPLAPISNSIFILKRVPAGSEQATRAHAVIERQTRHMIRLIDDLLDITRISQGKIRVQSDALDLVETVRSCLEDQSSMIEQGSLQLSLDLPARPVRVRGDYTRLCQVVGNLLSNAIKFTDSGGNVSVSLRQDEKANEAVLEVQDTGIGLDAALMPQLFQPFSQGANAYTRTNGGLGLGLALVKALVELHGGTVLASSAGANKGSLFTVRMPLETANVPTTTSL